MSIIFVLRYLWRFLCPDYLLPQGSRHIPTQKLVQMWRLPVASTYQEGMKRFGLNNWGLWGEQGRLFSQVWKAERGRKGAKEQAGSGFPWGWGMGPAWEVPGLLSLALSPSPIEGAPGSFISCWGYTGKREGWGLRAVRGLISYTGFRLLCHNNGLSSGTRWQPSFLPFKCDSCFFPFPPVPHCSQPVLTPCALLSQCIPGLILSASQSLLKHHWRGTQHADLTLESVVIRGHPFCSNYCRK